MLETNVQVRREGCRGSARTNRNGVKPDEQPGRALPRRVAQALTPAAVMLSALPSANLQIEVQQRRDGRHEARVQCSHPSPGSAIPSDGRHRFEACGNCTPLSHKSMQNHTNIAEWEPGRSAGLFSGLGGRTYYRGSGLVVIGCLFGQWG
jgi:hypothetical protein